MKFDHSSPVFSYQQWLIAAITVSLMGCQSGVLHQKHPTTVPLAPNAAAPKASSTLSCVGMVHCEIHQIGNQRAIDPMSHQPVAQNRMIQLRALTRVSAKSQPTSALQQVNYEVIFPSGQHVVHMRYYLDDALHTVENFSFLYDFAANQRYQLRAYRQVQTTDYTLLAQSAPTPLCIGLYEDNQLTNQWCKKPNPQGALSNEFIKLP